MPATAKEPSPTAAVIERLKGELADLKDELSRQRKRGTDVFIARLKMTVIPSKLKMAEITHSDKDIAVAKNILDEVRAELKTAAPKPPAELEENFKKEPAEEPINKVKDYIERAEEALLHGKKEEAAGLYSYVREHYKTLSPEQKKQILPECQKLAQQLKS